MTFPSSRLPQSVAAAWGRVAADHRSIVKGIAVVALFAALGRLAGAAKEVAVAWHYGVGAEIDAFLFVFNLVSWPVATWFAIVTVILIPIEARIRHNSAGQLARFRAEMLGLTLGIGCLAVGVLWIGLPLLVRSHWVHLPPKTAAIAVQMIPILIWLTPLGLLNGLYSTWTMSSGRHANTLFEGAPSIAILTGVLIFSGIGPLVWGCLLGTLLQFALLSGTMKSDEVGRLPVFHLSSPNWRAFWAGFSVMALGQAVFSLTLIVDQFFAARLGEGAISSLGYSGRVLSLVLGIVATAVTRATLPVFSRTRAGGRSNVRRAAIQWALVLAAAGAAIACVGWLIAVPALRLLYERGTFTSADTERVARIFRFGLLQIPFYFSSLVLVSLHSSHSAYRILLLSGLIGITVKTVASYLCIPYFGVAGLMIAQAAVYAVNSVLLFVAKPATA